ncbi:MAG: hypothetical protein Q9163_004201 [Psora crenata]
MGVLALVTESVQKLLGTQSIGLVTAIALFSFLALAVALNVLHQLLVKDPTQPPVVFHWVPFIGIQGNDFILNGKHKDLNAEEIYSPLTTPVFGKDVVYDCPNAKLMEQKRMVKFGLTSDALKSYVPLITSEIQSYIRKSPMFSSFRPHGTFDVPKVMAEITIYTASLSLQGREVRSKFDSSFADLYHDLDMGFSTINFMFPWAPLPRNRKRDRAQQKMAQTYFDIIKERRRAGNQRDSDDMVWHLMQSVYKDGTPVPDLEIAHMMIALLMAGQHSSSSTSAWILLRLATRPDIMDELYQEQLDVLGEDLPPLTYDGLQKLTLNAKVVKETLRLHAPIHTILRKVTCPMPVEGTPYTIPTTHVLLAAPGVTARHHNHFPEPDLWEPHRWDSDSPLTGTHKESTDPDDDKIDFGYGLVSKGTSSPYLPFGAGRHRCIGEAFAYVQLGVIVGEFARMFRLRMMDGQSDLVATDYSSLFSKPLAPALVQWEWRQKI